MALRSSIQCLMRYTHGYKGDTWVGSGIVGSTVEVRAQPTRGSLRLLQLVKSRCALAPRNSEGFRFGSSGFRVAHRGSTEGAETNKLLRNKLPGIRLSRERSRPPECV